jgi:hypothetical protein
VKQFRGNRLDNALYQGWFYFMQAGLTCQEGKKGKNDECVLILLMMLAPSKGPEIEIQRLGD